MANFPEEDVSEFARRVSKERGDAALQNLTNAKDQYYADHRAKENAALDCLTDYYKSNRAYATALRQAHFSVNQIADLFGVSKTTVAGYKSGQSFRGGAPRALTPAEITCLTNVMGPPTGKK
jgi:hypothetical protein